jgi:lipoprotein-anchoring transpeptidase ErfK/SrfK
VNKRNIIIAVAVVVVLGTLFLLPKKRSVQTAGGGSSSRTAKELYNQAASFKKDHQLVDAKKIYQQIVTEYPTINNVEQIQGELEGVNLDIIFSGADPAKTVVHEIKEGDSLVKIAKKYNTTIDLIKRMNNLKSDTINLGQKLKVWTGQFNIYVDKSQNILILRDGNELVKVYHVSTGVNNSTPVGKYKITNKLVDPVWFSKGAVVPPDSPANVLGSRWMGFDLPGYGIHGTTDPEKIGQQVTAGCVRMRNPEVEELYTFVTVGTEVTIVD